MVKSLRFAHYYPTLDNLLRELQNEIAQKFIRRVEGLKRPKDMDKIAREFFLSAEELGALVSRSFRLIVRQDLLTNVKA